MVAADNIRDQVYFIASIAKGWRKFCHCNRRVSIGLRGMVEETIGLDTASRLHARPGNVVAAELFTRGAGVFR